MSTPLVSCLMPTRNRADLVEKSIAMFAAQDYPRKELIIIADDPSDVRRSHIDEHGELYVSPGTLGAKLNYGARAAHGDICLNWDDDDWQGPNRIATQVAHLQLAGKPVVGFASLVYHREGDDYGWEYTGDAWYASGATHAYLRDYVLAHPRPDKTLGEDDDWIKAARPDLSTLSGTTVLVARVHSRNTAPYGHLYGHADAVPDSHDAILATLFGPADNFRRVPYHLFSATVER